MPGAAQAFGALRKPDLEIVVQGPTGGQRNGTEDGHDWIGKDAGKRGEHVGRRAGEHGASPEEQRGLRKPSAKVRTARTK
jgi:hypothetical protein